MVNISSFADRDVGQRDKMEDFVLHHEIETGGGLHLHVILVADGAGGGEAGELAARLTGRTINDHLEVSEETIIPKLLIEAVEEANRTVYSELQGEGTSTVALAVVDLDEDSDFGRLYIAHVGDSYICLMRDNQLIRLNIDHTIANEYLYAGQITDIEAERLANGAYPTRVIGVNPEIVVDIGFYIEQGSPIVNAQRAFSIGRMGMKLLEGDSVFVASDGIFGIDSENEPYIQNEEILRHALDNDVEKAVRNIIRYASNRNAEDNMALAMLFVPSRMRRAVVAARFSQTQKIALGGTLLVLLMLVLGLAIQFAASEEERKVAEATHVVDLLTQERLVEVILKLSATASFTPTLTPPFTPTPRPAFIVPNQIGWQFFGVNSPLIPTPVVPLEQYSSAENSMIIVEGENADERPNFQGAAVFMIPNSALEITFVDNTFLQEHYEQVLYPPMGEFFANNHVFERAGSMVLNLPQRSDMVFHAEAFCVAAKQIPPDLPEQEEERFAFTCFDGLCNVQMPNAEEIELTAGVRWLFDVTKGELISSGPILYSEVKEYYELVVDLTNSDEEIECVIPYLDEDEDGVSDLDDLCPLESGTIETNGCEDTDRDGVPDIIDECPSEFGVPELIGCPPPVALVELETQTQSVASILGVATASPTLDIQATETFEAQETQTSDAQQAIQTLDAQATETSLVQETQTSVVQATGLAEVTGTAAAQETLVALGTESVQETQTAAVEGTDNAAGTGTADAAIQGTALAEGTGTASSIETADAQAQGTLEAEGTGTAEAQAVFDAQTAAAVALTDAAALVETAAAVALTDAAAQAATDAYNTGQQNIQDTQQAIADMNAAATAAQQAVEAQQTVDAQGSETQAVIDGLTAAAETAAVIHVAETAAAQASFDAQTAAAQASFDAQTAAAQANIDAQTADAQASFDAAAIQTADAWVLTGVFRTLTMAAESNGAQNQTRSAETADAADVQASFVAQTADAQASLDAQTADAQASFDAQTAAAVAATDAAALLTADAAGSETAAFLALSVDDQNATLTSQALTAAAETAAAVAATDAAATADYFLTLTPVVATVEYVNTATQAVAETETQVVAGTATAVAADPETEVAYALTATSYFLTEGAPIPTRTQVPNVDLIVYKYAYPSSVTVGDTVYFDVYIVNNSSYTVTNINASDPLKSGFSYISHNTYYANGQTYASGDGSWTIPSINPNAYVYLSLRAEVLSTGDYDNLACVISLDQNDYDNTNDCESTDALSVSPLVAPLALPLDFQLEARMILPTNSPTASNTPIITITPLPTMADVIIPDATVPNVVLSITPTPSVIPTAEKASESTESASGGT